MDLSRNTDDEVFNLVANCIFEVMKDGSRRDMAQERLDASYPEIERRCRGRTDIGLLRALGYHVGSHKLVPRDRRHAILGYIFRSRLPHFRDWGYMAEWGEPLSEARRRRIAHSLRWFIDQNSRKPDMARACTEWNADHEFVMSNKLGDPLSAHYSKAC